MKEFKFVIITGLSGAGKTQAIHIFEDLGFFCIDNLPPALIVEFIKLCRKSRSKIWKVAVVVDIRGREFSGQLFNIFTQLNKMGFGYEILFLEASDKILLNRYKETRREHPLGNKLTIHENIQLERKYLELIKGKAKKILDTSNLSLGEFRREIIHGFLEEDSLKEINFTITAFGYKYGLPPEADLVFDVRFLPNPFYSSVLRPFSGENRKVRNFILKDKKTKEFLNSLFLFMKRIISLYLTEERIHVYIAIGCTGGKHRSIVVSDELSKFIIKQKHKVNVIYRDINRG